MEFDNEKPIYIQIASLLKEQIASGRRRAGDKLPSVREGSVLFEVSALTMQRVMQQLESEGIIISKKGIGYFIREEHAGSLQARLAREKTGEFVQTMKNCGLPLEEAVDLAGGLMEDTPAAKSRCADCRARLDQGQALGAALKESGLLPAAQCRLMELAQRSGAGDAAMDKIAQALTEDGELSLEEKVSRAEPALVLVCSVLVGLILLSVMLPLMHIMAAIG